jgi:NAD(P)H dehydrogenase (quinone)
MKVLVVHAHPEPQSFCTSLFRSAVESLTAASHQVRTSDLYAMGFDPVAKAVDFNSRARPDYLVYALEQRAAQQHGSLRADIEEEVAKVLWCDVLLVVAPMYWFSIPAVLKGWIDRVFISGLFYGGRRIYDRGGMRGRRALLALTLGGRDHMFGEDAIHGPMHELLRPIVRGSLQYVGFDVVAPFLAYHVPYVDDAARRDMAEQFLGWLPAALSEAPVLPAPRVADFDDSLRPIRTRTDEPVPGSES